MSGARAIRAAAVTAIVTVLSLGAARADTYLFTDTLRENRQVPEADLIAPSTQVLSPPRLRTRTETR